LNESLDQQSADHFSELTEILDYQGVSYTVNPRLVRGLDYYSHTVFEWVTETLGAQGTVCAGGRYDGLVEQLGGRANYAAGFAMGCERLISMLIDQSKAQTATSCDIYLMMRGEHTVRVAHKLAESLRDQMPQLTLLVHSGGGSFKSQMRKADKSGAKIALILGESEINENTVGLKFLREKKQQINVAQSDLALTLANML
jgi:histidyl-tRNA synthetase